jgi:MbtH protein
MNPEKEELYFVVMNHEEQYSIWPHWKDVPLGWTTIDSPMEKAACLEYIEKV